MNPTILKYQKIISNYIFMNKLQLFCQLFFLLTITNSFFLRNTHPHQNLIFFNDGANYLKVQQRNVQIWSYQPNTLIYNIETQEPILTVTLNPVDNRIFIFLQNGLKVENFQLQQATFSEIHWKGQIKSATWTPDNQHLVVIGTTVENQYFNQMIDISDLSIKRTSVTKSALFSTELIKQFCMIQDKLFIRQDGFKVKVFDVSEGKMQFIKELKNVNDGKCGDNGFYSVEEGGKAIRKYDKSFNVVKEKQFNEKIGNIEVKQSTGIVLSTEKKVYIMDNDFDLVEELEIDVPVRKIISIQNQQLVALELLNSKIKVISIVSYMQRILQFEVRNDSNDSNGTGLTEIVQPDSGFIVAMVVSFFIIIVIFIAMAIYFAINKDQLSGRESYIKKEQNMQKG